MRHLIMPLLAAGALLPSTAPASTAIVGAGGDDDNGSFSGSAYLFDTATGRQIAKLLPDDGAAGDRFGWSVAISGTTTFVPPALDMYPLG